MSFQPKVYTIGHVLGMTGMMVVATAFLYHTRSEHPELVWFMEHWGLYIGIGCTVVTFIFGLTILGTPWYDEETNTQLEADQIEAEEYWNSLSPEVQAIYTAAREIQYLQLSQYMQIDTLVRNQEQLKEYMKSQERFRR